MTDTHRILAWLRDAMDAAQRDAEEAGGDEWRTQEHPSDTVAIYDSKDEPVVYDEGSPSKQQQAHIVRNSPAVVLHRIAVDRKLLDLHADVAGKCVECGQGYESGDWGPDFPCATVRLLAESWGWTEAATKSDTMETVLDDAVETAAPESELPQLVPWWVVNSLWEGEREISRQRKRSGYYDYFFNRPPANAERPHSPGCYEASWG